MLAHLNDEETVSGQRDAEVVAGRVVGKAATPAAPVIDAANTKMLYNSKAGMDAKIIFNMPNNKAAGEPCYNLDVKTSHFRLYAQEEGKEPMLMGTTTSWAGLYYSIPTTKANAKVRLGVSAVAFSNHSFTFCGFFFICSAKLP